MAKIKSNGKYQSKTKGHNKSPKSHNGRRDPENRCKDITESDKPVNDVKWYMVDEKLGESAANLPFNVFPGTPEKIWQTGSENATYSVDATPGVLTVRYATVPGDSTEATSALNVAMRKIFTDVRRRNSGSTNYEAPDLTLTILAALDIFADIGEAKRIYRLANTYEMVNRNIPDLLLYACGTDPHNIRDNLAQFRYGLNALIHKANSLSIPNVFSLFERSSLLTTSIFTDSTSRQSQFYMFVRSHYFKYDPTKYTTGGCLESFERIKSSWDTYTKILNDINARLDVLLEDEDINIQMGDMKKAYGDAGLIQLQLLSGDETQECIFDEDILNQVENAYSMNPTVPDIYQENGILLFKPKPSYSTDLAAQQVMGRIPWLAFTRGYYDRFLNSHKDQPGWKDVLEWTRLSNAGYNTNNNPSISSGNNYVSCGSELITGFRLMTKDYSTNDYGQVWNATDHIAYFDFDSVIGKDYTSADAVTIRSTIVAELISFFDWHPIVYSYFKMGSSAWIYAGAKYDAKVHTITTGHIELKRLNELAVMGLLKVDLPTVG